MASVSVHRDSLSLLASLVAHYSPEVIRTGSSSCSSHLKTVRRNIGFDDEAWAGSTSLIALDMRSRDALVFLIILAATHTLTRSRRV